MDEKLIKKRHMKMLDAVFKFNAGDSTFPEMIKTMMQVEEFYRE